MSSDCQSDRYYLWSDSGLPDEVVLNPPSEVTTLSSQTDKDSNTTEEAMWVSDPLQQVTFSMFSYPLNMSTLQESQGKEERGGGRGR